MVKIPDGEELQSQSHRTDQVSSEIQRLRQPDHGRLLVAIPPYRSGQFRGREGVTNPVHQKSQSHRTDQVSSEVGTLTAANKDDGEVVAIPPYRSGQFRLSPL